MTARYRAGHTADSECPDGAECPGDVPHGVAGCWDPSAASARLRDPHPAESVCQGTALGPDPRRGDGAFWQPSDQAQRNPMTRGEGDCTARVLPRRGSGRGSTACVRSQGPRVVHHSKRPLGIQWAPPGTPRHKRRGRVRCRRHWLYDTNGPPCLTSPGDGLAALGEAPPYQARPMPSPGRAQQSGA